MSCALASDDTRGGSGATLALARARAAPPAKSTSANDWPRSRSRLPRSGLPRRVVRVRRTTAPGPELLAAGPVHLAYSPESGYTGGFASPSKESPANGVVKKGVSVPVASKEPSHRYRLRPGHPTEQIATFPAPRRRFAVVASMVRQARTISETASAPARRSAQHSPSPGSATAGAVSHYLAGQRPFPWPGPATA